MATQSLSDLQEKVLATVPIPSALLSIFGSAVIIYMTLKSRQRKTWTTYTRLLLALSVTDILFSITLAAAPFLRPQETSTRIWAFGNDATCSAIGFLNYASLSNRFYNGMLSVYFLLTTRYGFTNARLVKRIEPLMHLASIACPLAFAVQYVIKNEYGEVGSAVGCLRNVPIVDENGESTESEPRVFYSLSLVVFFFILIISNGMTLSYVRQQTRSISKKKRRSTLGRNDGRLEADGRGDDGRILGDGSSPVGGESHHSPTDEVVSSTFSLRSADEDADKKPSQRMLKHEKKQQKKRLKLIYSQALLFVASYFFCNIWNGIIFIIGNDSVIYAKHYHFAVIESLMLPLQGLLNMMVYFRPKYLKRRQQNPDGSFWEVLKCAILDRNPKEKVVQEQQQQEKEVDAKSRPGLKQDAAAAAVGVPEGGEQQSPAARHFYVPTAMGSPIKDQISTLTASIGVLEEHRADNRWGAATATTRNSSHAVSSKSSVGWTAIKTPASRSSANERISTGLDAVSEKLAASSVGEESTSNVRWLSDSHRSSTPTSIKKQKAKAASTKSLAMPQRLSSDFDITDDMEVAVPEEETGMEKKRSKSSAMFLPMPMRKSSEPMEDP